MEKVTIRRRPPSIETRLKISASCKGRKSPSYWAGKKHSLEHIAKRTGENMVSWKGDNAGYVAKHTWIKNKLGKPSICWECGKTSSTRFEWANISGEYKREIEDWARLCPSCHRNYDYGNIELILKFK